MPIAEAIKHVVYAKLGAAALSLWTTNVTVRIPTRLLGCDYFLDLNGCEADKLRETTSYEIDMVMS